MESAIKYKSRRSAPSLSRGNQSWYVYIAIAKTRRYYTGITPNTEKRIEKHNAGKGSRFAIQQGGLSLIYKSEPFPSKSEARKREAQIKRWNREKKEKLISSEWK